MQQKQKESLQRIFGIREGTFLGESTRQKFLELVGKAQNIKHDGKTAEVQFF